MAETGAGFPEPAVETVSSMGLNIYLQIYGWSGNEENIPAVFADFEALEVRNSFPKPGTPDSLAKGATCLGAGTARRSHQ